MQSDLGLPSWSWRRSSPSFTITCRTTFRDQNPYGSKTREVIYSKNRGVMLGSSSGLIHHLQLLNKKEKPLNTRSDGLQPKSDGLQPKHKAHGGMLSLLQTLQLWRHEHQRFFWTSSCGRWNGGVSETRWTCHALGVFKQEGSTSNKNVCICMCIYIYIHKHTSHGQWNQSCV